MGLWRRAYSSCWFSWTDILKAFRIMGERLHDPGPHVPGRRPLLGRALPIAARAVDGDRVDGAPRAVAGHGEDRLHVGLERSLERLQGHEGVVAVLLLRELR